MVTVEIPIVCVTAAAGLGVRGVVITPCACNTVDTKILKKQIVNAVVIFFIALG
jgi:hypothetical protein